MVLFVFSSGEDNCNPPANCLPYFWNGCLPGGVWSPYTDLCPLTREVKQNKAVSDSQLSVHSSVRLFHPCPVFHDLHGYPSQKVSRVEKYHIYSVYKNFRCQGKKSCLVRPLDLRYVYCLLHAVCRMFYNLNSLSKVQSLGPLLRLVCPSDVHIQFRVSNYLVSF